METLDDAKSAAQKSHLDKVKANLDAGEKLQLECQKHILLVDKSDSGWFTVEEYKKHNLADNSDNKKIIFSAEHCAQSTLSSLRKKRMLHLPHPRDLHLHEHLFLLLHPALATTSSDSVSHTPK